MFISQENPLQRHPNVIKIKKDDNNKQHPKEEENFDFQSYYIIKFKCLVFNKVVPRNKKKMQSTTPLKEKINNRNYHSKIPEQVWRKME